MTSRAAPCASGTGDIAVTPHRLATDAALQVMAEGGNAVDGAIAANAVLGVVLPTACGVGGDLFALIHTPGDTAPLALNASGMAGAGAGSVAASGIDDLPLYSHWTITVPGCVDGWEALATRLGTLPLDGLLEPALAATRGFAASPELSRALTALQPHIADEGSAFELYPQGAPPAPGDRMQRPALRTVLTDLAHGGRASFYQGPVGRAIESATRGVITPGDLATVQADWIEPLALGVFGLRAFTMPPNSQGYLTLAAAWIAEHAGVPGGDTAAEQHLLIEAYRAVAWERDAVVADPRHAPIIPAELIASRRLAPRAAMVGGDTVASWPPASSDPGGTAYLCVVDRHGMGVSLIQSNFHGIGSRISAGNTGVWLHNRGAGFTLQPGHPNELAPGKRPLHTLSPTLWIDGDRLRLLLGTRGGHQQPQLLLQAASHLFRSGLSPAAAQEAPRWTMDVMGIGTTSQVRVESRMPARVVTGLERRGHHVEIAGEWEPGWGPVSIVTVDDRGVRRGAADPRIATAAARAAPA